MEEVREVSLVKCIFETSNVKYVSVRSWAWSKRESRNERETRGLLSFFFLPPLPLFLSFFSFDPIIRPGWIVINVTTPGTTAKLLTGWWWLVIGSVEKKKWWKRARRRSEISRRVFSIGRYLYLRSPQPGHPMRVLQKARSKRQREEVDRLWTYTYTSPPEYISPPRGVFIAVIRQPPGYSWLSGGMAGS